MKSKLILLIAFSFALLRCSKTEKDPTPLPPVEITSKVLTQNLQHVWEILWGPDNHIWLTERSGKISRVNPGTGALIPLFTIPDIQSNGEGGLLGMVLHPNFSSTPYVYVAYNYNSGGNYREKIVRYTHNGTTLVSPFTLIDNIPAASIHNGCRLVIVNNTIFISTGDANNTAMPQNNSSASGKILRLNLDGSIPADNPSASSPIWSSGHRNPQGLVFANNILYSSEHGPSNDDEVNIIEKGRNYGWPNVHGFCNEPAEASFCTPNNVREPLKAWTPTVATCGLDYYNSDLIPQWKNSLLLATLKNTRLYQLKLDDPGTTITETNEFFNGQYGRLRDICISPEGKVYISTSNGTDDKIVEVSKK